MSSSFCVAFFLLIAVKITFADAEAESPRIIRAAPGEKTTGNYIVVMGKETSHSTFEHIADEVRRESIDQKLSVKVEGPFAKILSAKLTKDAAHRIALMQNEGVFIEEETYASIDMSWAVDRVDQVSSVLDNQPYTPCECGNGVDVYVLDTGIRYDHCEFGRTKYSDYVFDGGRAKYSGYDPIDNYNDTNLEGRDCHGHGTNVASLAVGNVSGLACCATAYSVRVLDCNGRGPYSVIIDGLNYAAIRIKDSNRPAVIVMSLGGSFSSSLNQVITNVINQGIPVVTSAGNNRGNACSRSPASNPGVITVAATTIGDFINYNTNAGPCVDIFAPGAYVTAASHTCSTCSCTKAVSGTSMAAALVTGAVALLLEKEPLFFPSNISDKLKENCLKNAINFIFLENSYKSTTNNCFLHIKKCDECGISTTSIITITPTSTSTCYIGTLTKNATLTKTTTMTNITTLVNTVTSTDTTTVLGITTPVHKVTSTHHATTTYHTTLTSRTTLTHNATSMLLTTSTYNATSTHHTTTTRHITSMNHTITVTHDAVIIRPTTSTRYATSMHHTTVTRHITPIDDTTSTHHTTTTVHTTLIPRTTSTHTTTTTRHSTSIRPTATTLSVHVTCTDTVFSTTTPTHTVTKYTTEFNTVVATHPICQQ
ncbi:PREDICTED: uncharacterized protein LOC100638844 [Amphimedon queenslandica]|uniref:Peptidase S8/S53 domain-containing protein n=1 Tax=Amphimedon queenslandica TaxID=400682 RepID=A0A1X7VEH2_AMPQE|nr:PREDICTED: uncharacterized protein LOC100638844 [Amphimedon queenslandica]|eukprot:XP_019849384.1 PREDICTED: uncharacterized protein LOC100638844 [Amphimedon queenslandica]